MPVVLALQQIEINFTGMRSGVRIVGDHPSTATRPCVRYQRHRPRDPNSRDGAGAAFLPEALLRAPDVLDRVEG